MASILTIGLLLLVSAGVLGALLAARGVHGEWALVLGLALSFVVLAGLALPWHSCDGSQTVTVYEPGESDFASCGGVHPGIWLALAGAVGAAAIAGRRA